MPVQITSRSRWDSRQFTESTHQSAKEIQTKNKRSHKTSFHTHTHTQTIDFLALELCRSVDFMKIEEKDKKKQCSMDRNQQTARPSASNLRRLRKKKNNKNKPKINQNHRRRRQSGPASPAERDVAGSRFLKKKFTFFCGVCDQWMKQPPLVGRFFFYF